MEKALLLILALLLSNVAAHGPEFLSSYGRLVKRAHVDAASNCANANTFASALTQSRMRRMKLAKRDWDPTYSTIQNTTCVLNPEVTEGPYWIAGELVRQNVTDEEPGFPLLLDMGVMDVNTCEPIPGAYIEVIEFQGFYSGYTTATLDPPPGAPPGVLPGRRRGHAPLTDNLNFFRGAYPTNKNGIVEFATQFPGYYEGRTTHIHLMVTLNPTVHANGTVTGGKTVHIGQIFFDTKIKDKVFELAPYATDRPDKEVTNEDDEIFLQESENGNNPIVSLVSLGDSIEDGFLGYITIGVNPDFDIRRSRAPLYGSPVQVWRAKFWIQATQRLRDWRDFVIGVFQLKGRAD
ncbi:aromatic compound dioxygenase [Cladochytrium replicatum]|nr:aromatic compound dioxygenase [Cladochytrium replicatum]